MYVQDQSGEVTIACAVLGQGTSIGLYKPGQNQKTFARVAWVKKTDDEWHVYATQNSFRQFGTIFFYPDKAEFCDTNDIVQATAALDGAVTLASGTEPIAFVMLEEGETCPDIDKIRMAVALAAVAEALVSV